MTIRPFPAALSAAALLAPLLLATPALARAPDFGDDTSRWANDGECDDRRFVGPGMASVVSTELLGQDAADCSRLRTYGLIALCDC